MAETTKFEAAKKAKEAKEAKETTGGARAPACADASPAAPYQRRGMACAQRGGGRPLERKHDHLISATGER